MYAVHAYRKKCKKTETCFEHYECKFYIYTLSPSYILRYVLYINMNQHIFEICLWWMFVCCRKSTSREKKYIHICEVCFCILTFIEHIGDSNSPQKATSAWKPIDAKYMKSCCSSIWKRERGSEIDYYCHANIYNLRSLNFKF